MPPSAISVVVRSLDRLRRFVNRGDLRNTDAGNDPRRADRSRPDAHLHCVSPGRHQVARSVARCHVASHDVDIPPLLHFADRLDHVGRVAMGTIDDEEIDIFLDQAAGPLIIEDSDGRSNPQPTLPVFGCLREATHHVDVFDRNQSGQSVIFVNQQKLLDLFCHQNLLSLLKRYGPRAVTRCSLVITSLIGTSLCSRKRRSRRVMMPTS